MEGFRVETRQKDDALVDPPDPVLDGNATASLGESKVAGYSKIAVLGISDRSFRIRVEESTGPDGPWTLTQTIASALDAGSGFQVAKSRFSPVGGWARFFADNLTGSPTAVLDVSIQGVPLN